jgi:nucleoside 2-deoxyribosyltransferase
MIYIAAPFFNSKQIDFVMEIENILDEYDMEYFSPRSFGIIHKLSDEDKAKRIKAIYECNVEKICEADTMIAVIDDLDTGTIWEMGYATAIDIDIISISNHDYGLNVMLANSVRCHIKHIDDIPNAVANKEYRGFLVEKGIY